TQERRAFGEVSADRFAVDSDIGPAKAGPGAEPGARQGNVRYTHLGSHRMPRSAPSARQPVYVTGKARHVSEGDPTDGASSYDGASEGERLHVQLAPEPDFPISGAVALRAPDGGLLGYLGAGAAAVYHPL